MFGKPPRSGPHAADAVLESRDDELQIAHRAREVVDARDDQRLAGVDEVEDGLELGTPVRVAPSPVSVRTMVQRAVSSAASWASRFWSAVETLA